MTRPTTWKPYFLWLTGSSDLTEWAKHGVLLLNTSLTVRAHEVSARSVESRGGHCTLSGSLVNSVDDPYVDAGF